MLDVEEIHRFSDCLAEIGLDKKFVHLRESSEQLAILTNLMQIDIVQAMIYKLWRPGLFNVSDIMKMTEKSSYEINKYAKLLISLGVIKELMPGMYNGGKYRMLMMSIYALMITEIEKSDYRED